MPSDSLFARALLACGLVAALAACAAPTAPKPAPEPMRAMALPAAAPASAPVQVVAAPAAAPAPANGTNALESAIGYAERVRSLAPNDLAQEVQRLGDTPYSPLRATQLALALAQSRTPPNTARAQSLLQRVQADPTSEAAGLQPFARLIAAQLTEQRRADEQAERQAQQLRDAQKRIDQLNDRLEAVRAIERSLPGPARREPGAPQRP
jgi:hypothetical protein